MLDFKCTNNTTVNCGSYKHKNISINVYLCPYKIYFQHLSIKRTNDLTPILEAIKILLRNSNDSNITKISIR